MKIDELYCGQRLWSPLVKQHFIVGAVYFQGGRWIYGGFWGDLPEEFEDGFSSLGSLVAA